MAWLDPLLALLLLLPAAWLAWPATLAHQLEPELSATGWWLLLQIPAALLLLLRTPRSRSLLVSVFAGFVAVSLWRASQAQSDSLSATRAVLAAATALSALVAGSTLGSTGRRVFAIGLVPISIGLCLPALAGVAPRLQGALQNSGATSEAALLGALVALAVFVAERGSLRGIALITIGAFGAFVAVAPVLAGALVFCGSALVAWFVRKKDRVGIALCLCIFALAAAGAFAYVRAFPAAKAPAQVDTERQPEGHFGGAAVRLSIAPRALALFADHALIGVGPGQFRACFPSYRDADERVRSNRAAGGGVETEVEHAHNDVLTTLAENGLVGGVFWIVFLISLALTALRALKHDDLARNSLALAVLGLLANSLLRAPLTFNPASESLFFAAAGALLARDDETPPPKWIRRLLPLLCVLLLALQAPGALAFVRHGLALRAPDGIDLSGALAACPDSPLALSLEARKLAADPARIADARAKWEKVLGLRPLNFEALVQAGVLAAGAGDSAAARAHWLRAIELAPERIGVLQNLLLLDARSGEDADFTAASSRASGKVERAWAIETGAKEMLSGDERAALRLWTFARCDWVSETPEQVYERSRAAASEPSPLVKAWELLAHMRWARDHAATNDFSGAVRSYRQALRLGPDSRAVRLELAAALWSDGKQDDARTEIDRAAARAPDWSRLSPWAVDVLSKAGVYGVR